MRIHVVVGIFVAFVVGESPAQETPPPGMVLHRGRFFVDRDGNGAMDAAEPAATGVTLHQGPRSWSADKNGEYAVLTPVPMTGAVWFEIPAGYKLTGPWHLPMLGRESGGKIRQQDIPLLPGGPAPASTVSILAVSVVMPTDDAATATLRSGLERAISKTQPDLLLVATSGAAAATGDPSRWPALARRLGVPIRFAVDNATSPTDEWSAGFGPLRYSFRLGSRRWLVLHPSADGTAVADLESVRSGARIVVSGGFLNDASTDALADAGAELLVLPGAGGVWPGKGSSRIVELPVFTPQDRTGVPDGFALILYGSGGVLDVRIVHGEVPPPSEDSPVAAESEADQPSAAVETDADESPAGVVESSVVPEFEAPARQNARTVIDHRHVRGSLEKSLARVGVTVAGDTKARIPEAGTMDRPITPRLLASQVVAHRGGAAEAPENTLTAIRHALSAGAGAVEIDVQITRDGEIVVFHDDVLGSGAGGAMGRAVTELTWDEMSRQNVGRDGAPETPPRLQDVLELEWSSGTRLMLEAKHGASDGALARRLAEVVGRSKHKDVVVWGSIDPALCRALAEADADVPLVGIVPTLEELPGFAGLPIEIWAVSDAVAGPEVIARLRRPGVRVWVWTVNDGPRAEILLAAGADAVITDRPGAFLAK